MNRYTHFLKPSAIVLFATLFAGFALADPPGRVARLSWVEGEVSFAPERTGKDDNWATAKINWPLTQGNRLFAGDNARAELQIGASALRLSENTALDFTRLDDERIEAFLERGSLSVTLRNWDGDDQLVVTTPSVSVTLNKNGRYRIDLDGDTANVIVRQGEANIQNGDSRFNLIAAQRAEISGGDVHISRNDDDDSFDRWAAERDSRQVVTTSSRYVAPTTPGIYELDQYGQWSDTSEYGQVWRPNNVAGDWAPYRHGRWEWITPWGWTWIDDAPWGFAPSHYGRWVYVDRYWAWHPGRIIARPVYAPALVSFIGGPGFSVSVNVGQPCGWVPLAPWEVYYPYYQSSHRYVERINVTHVRNGYVIDRDYRHDRGHHRNRDYPGGVTVVDPRVMVDRLPVARAILPVERHILRDVARIAPPLPPLPGLGRLLPRPIIERHVDREQPRDEDRWRRPERKFQTGGPAPVRRAEQKSQMDYQIPRHEVDTRVPLIVEGQRPQPAVREIPPEILGRPIPRERPVGERPLPRNDRPLPHNSQPLPQNDRPLPGSIRSLPAPRVETQREVSGEGKAKTGGAPANQNGKRMTGPR